MMAAYYNHPTFVLLPMLEYVLTKLAFSISFPRFKSTTSVLADSLKPILNHTLPSIPNVLIAMALIPVKGDGVPTSFPLGNEGLVVV